MIGIDLQNRKPIYEQIVERFQTLIVNGILDPDSQMPSVRSLAMELSINPNTIQKEQSIAAVIIFRIVNHIFFINSLLSHFHCLF